MLLQQLLDQAVVNPRLRQNYDMRTSSEDGSQRMLNALLPGTVVPVHRHAMSSESVFLLCGKLVEIIYDSEGKEEIERIHLDPSLGKFGCVVPKGAWHTVEVLEPSVIFEAKDGAYGKDGSESLDEYNSRKALDPSRESFSNSLGDLKKNIEYLIGMEHQSGSMDAISPLYVSRMLNVPLEEVEKCMETII